MPFHATVNIDNKQLDLFEAKAQSQEDRIYELFCEVRKPLAWFEVKGYLDFNDCSIKRCLSNLKDKGVLIKTSENVTGTFGKPCYRYELKSNNLNIV
jgi:predicted transcriptional regulator